MAKITDYFETVILTNSHRLPLGKDDGFGIFLSEAMYHISTNNNLTKLDLKLMFFLLSCLSNKKVHLGGNEILLFTGKEFEEILGAKQPHIVNSLKNLEKEKYIRRHKSRRTIILLSPKVAYAGKFKDYLKTHNRLARRFDYSKVEYRPPQEKLYQDWTESSLKEQLEEKRKKFSKQEDDWNPFEDD